MRLWSKQERIQTIIATKPNFDVPHTYFGVITVTRLDRLVFDIVFTDRGKEKLSEMTYDEPLFYLTAINDSVDFSILSTEFQLAVSVREFFAYKFLVETILDLLQDKKSDRLTGNGSKGRYNLARGSTSDSV